MYKETEVAEEECPEDTVINQMRCLEALGYWTELTNLSANHNFDVDSDGMKRDLEKKQKLSQMSARGWWAIGDYLNMAKRVAEISENYHEGAFLRAALAIRENRFPDAAQLIVKVTIFSQ